jgi:2-polyprenyl-3-methyl-5-hydroxy-6-metoxy-1,4-benzoquinol methylase
MDKIEKTKNYFNNKNSDNPIEAMDWVIGGQPLPMERFQELYVRPVIDVLELGPGSVVLDVGCGAGVMVDTMAPLVGHIEGFDLSERLVSLYKGKEKLYVSSIEDADIPAGKFNRICMFSVAIFFPDFEYFCRIVRLLTERLDENGILLIGDQRIGDPSSHQQYLTIDPGALANFLFSLNYPFTIKCQIRNKRDLVKGRYDILIYKDKK